MKAISTGCGHYSGGNMNGGAHAVAAAPCILAFTFLRGLMPPLLTFFVFILFSLRQQMKCILSVALVASASAFVPAQNARMPTKLNFEYGEYDDKMYNQDSKKDVYNKWDPSAPRSTRNFNPFETFKGNSPDASGIYPGEVSD